MSVMHERGEAGENGAPEEAGEHLLGKVLHPKGTRDFPPGGRVSVRNLGNEKGRFSLKETGGEVQHHSIMPGDWFNRRTPLGAVLKNIGTVDLDVTP